LRGFRSDGSSFFPPRGAARRRALAIVADPAVAKVSKADVFYRDAPKEGKSCAACRLFTPGESGRGTCAVVEGPVSANGWCMAFSARPQ